MNHNETMLTRQVRQLQAVSNMYIVMSNFKDIVQLLNDCTEYTYIYTHDEIDAINFIREKLRQITDALSVRLTKVNAHLREEITEQEIYEDNNRFLLCGCHPQCIC
jgi:division protein CdvB (Snf7/Vps24/ESCRT-III family)